MEFKVRPNRPFEFTDVGLISLGEKGRYITELDLYGCENITDEGLLSLSCPNLEKIDLSFCKKLTAKAVATFVATCPKLQYLTLKRFPQIDAHFLPVLCCPNLLSFDVYDLQDATDQDLQIFLSNVPHLEILRINTAPLVKGHFIPVFVEHCKNLRFLELIAIPITVTEGIGVMPQVTTLVLDLPPEAIELFLAHCPNVRLAKVPEWIPVRCDQLVEIHLKKIDDDGLSHLAHNCRMLETVCIENGRKITDKGLSVLLSLFPMLEDIQIKLCRSINGAEIKGAETLKLTKLGLTDCTTLSDEGVEKLMKYCSDLFLLSLTNCNQLTGKALTAIVNHTDRLESLELTQLGTPIRFSAEPMKFLEDVDFRGSAGITDDSLVDLTSAAPNIERINLSDCPNITIKGLLYLMDHCPHVSRLTLWNCKISEIELVMLEEMGEVQIDAYRGMKAYSAENADFSFDYYKGTPEAKIAFEKLTSLLTRENRKDLSQGNASSGC